jgi:cellulose synthase/poly-beta-1,6-N-acetylglucosamine synthase-like glycosyltransferase
MACCATAEVISACLDALLWCWVALQFAYWLFIYVGIRRFNGVRDHVGDLSPSECTIVIPAYNEAVHLPLIAANLKHARLTRMIAIVVDDGSDDGSGNELARLCEQEGAWLLSYPRNRGKAAALCSGLAAARTESVMTLDADTIIPIPLDVHMPGLRGIGAVAFTIMPIKTGRFLGAAQSAEYAHILNFERLGLAGFGIALTVPGAASLWRKEALVRVGGFSARTTAEDTDATISLQFEGWRVAVVPEVTATTDCPATLKTLVRQRARWIWGNFHVARYAAVACLTRCSAGRSAALALIAANLMAFAGYLIATITIVRFALLDITFSDVAASIVLCLATLVRIIVSRHLRPVPRQRLLFALVALLSMQAINLVGFWAGVSKRRRRW